jgi:hypothetical protein
MNLFGGLKAQGELVAVFVNHFTAEVSPRITEALWDAFFGGTGIVRDGKRIDPRTIYLPPSAKSQAEYEASLNAGKETGFTTVTQGMKDFYLDRLGNRTP